MITLKSLPAARDARIYMAVERTFLGYLRFGAGILAFAVFFFRVGKIYFQSMHQFGEPAYYLTTFAMALGGAGFIAFSLFSFDSDMKYIDKGIPVDKKETTDPRIYMAAERTFLAWIRTSISLIVFGFVVENFELLLKQLGMANKVVVLPHTSLVEAGIFIILTGVATVVIGLVNFQQAIKQIDGGTYRTNVTVYRAYGLIIFGSCLIIIAFMFRLME